MNLLRIAARVAEHVAIRNLPYNRKKGEKPPKFDINEFKSIKDSVEALEYAKDRLKFIGSGSSRTTFEYSSGKVLKVASPFREVGNQKAGIAQNKAEVDIYTNPRTKPITTKIFDYDSSFNWIISEIVRPAKSGEFLRYVGCSTYEAIELADDLVKTGIYNEVEGFDGPVNEEFIRAVASLMKEGVLGADLEVISHWGKTADGRMVVMDYGFTEEVGSGFYGRNEGGNFDDYSNMKTVKIEESPYDP